MCLINFATVFTSWPCNGTENTCESILEKMIGKFPNRPEQVVGLQVDGIEAGPMIYSCAAQNVGEELGETGWVGLGLGCHAFSFQLHMCFPVKLHLPLP
eukprot:5723211-Pyramimonas_sp.AAC.1